MAELKKQNSDNIPAKGNVRGVLKQSSSLIKP